jgi:arginine-tRNA-protein transferase
MWVKKTTRRLDFFLSPRHACAYLPERKAQTVFADPSVPLDRHRYSQLIAYGYRRSGAYIYRPACPACRACVPVRIPVACFTPNRAQRRCRKRNRDLQVTARSAAFDQDHFELYCAYQRARHPGGSMDNQNPRNYADFLWASWSDTVLYEFRDAEHNLLGVSACDRLDHALSAVYTFYDTNARQRGLGTFAILWEIERCLQRGLKWLYLGYWIEAAPKMAYKTNFRPLEGLTARGWEELSGDRGPGTGDRGGT